MGVGPPLYRVRFSRCVCSIGQLGVTNHSVVRS